MQYMAHGRTPMSAYFARNSKERSGQKVTNPITNTTFFDSKKKSFLVIVLVLCLLPSLLNLLGLDFSSNITALKPNQAIEANNLFNALAGALHHTLL